MELTVAAVLRIPVLLEVPFPGQAPQGWEAVWKAVQEAIMSLEQGGEIGWKHCISAARLALENWQKIEKEDHGPT
jgi:hypothetical protein